MIVSAPFGEVITDETKDRYWQSWARFITFVTYYKDFTEKDRRFALTETQKTGVDNYVTIVTAVSPKPNRAERVRALLNISLILVAHDLGASRQSVHPLFAYTVLSNLHKGNNFADPHIVSPFLAGLEYFVRSIIFSAAIRDSAQPGSSLYDTVSMYRQWIVEGRNTPFAWLRQMLHLSAHYIFDTNRMPRFMWSGQGASSFWFDGDLIQYKHIQLMIRTKVQRVHDLFNRLWTLYGLPLEWMTSQTIWKDVHRERATNYCFLDAPENFKLADLGKRALQHVMKSNYFSGVAGGKLYWYESRVRRVLKASQEFMAELACAMYLTGGQPPRGTELMATLIRNLPGRLRNLFVIDGTLVNVGFLNKTSFILKHDKPIPRAFNQLISSILINYIAVIRKIEHVFYSNLPNVSAALAQRTQMSLFFVAGLQIDTNIFTRILKETTLEALGVATGFGTADCRHIMMYIGKRFVRQSTDWEGQALLDFQSGHSSGVARAWYAVEGNSLPSGLNPDSLRSFMQVSFAHHAEFGIQNMTLTTMEASDDEEDMFNI